MTGSVSPEGEGEKRSDPAGAGGGRSAPSAGEGEQGLAVLAVLGASRRAVLVGDARVADFGSLERDARLVGEAGPDLVGCLAGDGAFLPADDGGHGAVWGPGQRRILRVSLSRAVFWAKNRQTDGHLHIWAPLKFS